MSGDNQDTKKTLAAIRQLVESQNQSGADEALRLDTIVWRGATGREDHIPHVADLAKSGTPTPSPHQPVAKTPAINTPATNRPATNTPATNTPATNRPAANTPAANSPATKTSGWQNTQPDISAHAEQRPGARPAYETGLTAGSFGAHHTADETMPQQPAAPSDISAPSAGMTAYNAPPFAPPQPNPPAPSYNRQPDLHQMPPVADNSPLPRLPKLGAAKEAELWRQRQEEAAARQQLNQPQNEVGERVPNDSDITPPQTAAMMESRISDIASDIKGDASKPTRESSYQAERAPQHEESGLDGSQLSAFPDLRLVGMDEEDAEEDSTSGLFTRSVRSAMQDIIRSQINGWLRENMTEIIEDALREELRPSKPVSRSKTRLNRKFDKRNDT